MKVQGQATRTVSEMERDDILKGGRVLEGPEPINNIFNRMRRRRVT